MLQVSALWRYPIKSAAGEQVQALGCAPDGVIGDREFVVINEKSELVSQRKNKEFGICEVLSMCRITPCLTPDYLILSADKIRDSVVVRRNQSRGEIVQISIFGHEGPAVEVSKEASDWLTAFLNDERPGTYRLMRTAPNWHRPGKTGTAGFAFADGDPLLMISEASLAELNRRLLEKGEPEVGFDRFRPNIVISGCSKPHEEDTLDALRIERILFIGRKRNVRCPFIQVNQETARRSAEPYRTLLEYRISPYHEGPGKNNDVVFGRKFGYKGAGEISVGSRIELASA